ncbi:hypothetical protein HCC61_20080 [Streptomyces sp. HNM0575]|uniref:hypothetical protein n=1 Tax=Streptomyces sp. HNM0575 TaxID=2716338 RepID=UPI00145ED68B|nr:hypothetical protein [Streptomyces sp. HNM0575]NLU74948.1 hypothetical protein [Streptomyces sp. HNM0575]
MKPLHLKGAAALAAAALVGVGYQTAFGSESGPHRQSGSTSPAPASMAPSAQAPAAPKLKVSYWGKSLEAELTDIAPVSADEGWAVGTSRNDDGSGEAKQILLHRKGKEWKPSPVPEGGEKTLLTRVDASGPDNVWVFGMKTAGEKPPVAFRWDGKQWHEMKVPVANDRWEGPRSTAVLAADDVWLLGGERNAYHWDGRKWTKSQLPAVAMDIAGTGGRDVWAVGLRDTGDDDGGGPMSQPSAMHWDGKKWKTAETPEYHFPDPPAEEASSLDAVVAVSENEVWALGRHDYNHGEGGPEPEDEVILLRWDGNAWKEAPEKAAKKAEMLASDGDGGLMLDTDLHMTKDGALHKIAKAEPVPGRSGKVEPVDKKQGFVNDKAVLVPGTRQVWCGGTITLGSHGDANFRRAGVVSYDAG